MITVLIPAHNEQDTIQQVVDSVKQQHLAADKIIVIADNCTDNTVSLANDMGVEVYETVHNKHKKAGALNQVLSWVLPDATDDDYIMVLDADSILDPRFLMSAKQHLDDDAGLGGVGGTFSGREGGGYVGWLQRNEYARYERDVDRKRGKVVVLTGTASLFRARVMKEVIQARIDGDVIPKSAPQVYDTEVLTEDNELSIAIKHLGYRILSPTGCRLSTEIMETWKMLWNQRLRWRRGAMENCIQYGLTKITARYWGRQVIMFLGFWITVIYLGSIAYSVATQTFHFHMFFLSLTLIFALERAVTVRSRGKWHQVAAFFMIFEMPMEFFMQGVYGKALLDTVFKRSKAW